MKKFVIGIGVVAALLVAVALIVPRLIDWDALREQVAAQAREATGREIHLDGEVSVALFPTPALVAHGVRLANLPGASEPDMARLKSLEIQVALGPLLGGEIQVRMIKLVEPVIQLEALEDGRANWEFTPAPHAGSAAPAESPAPAAPGAEPEAKALPAIRLDTFLIERGLVIYRDRKAGTEERVEIPTATVAAASLEGPFDSTGQIVARGLPFSYEVSVGKMVQERTVPLNLALTAEAGGTEVRLGGALLGLPTEPRFKGTLKAGGHDLAGLIGLITGGESLPGVLAQNFLLEGTVTGHAAGAEAEGLMVRLGDTPATADVRLSLVEALDVAVDLSAKSIDLDRWLSLPAARPTTAPVQGGSAGSPPEAGPTPAGAPAPATAAAKSGSFALPTGLTASLRMAVESVTYRGDAIQAARVNAELANGEIVLSQLSAQLPGQSDVAMFGFVTAANGKPRLEGDLEAKTGDLRKVLAWLGVELPPLPQDRLRKLAFNTKVIGGAESVQVKDLTLRVDGSTVTGAATVALRERPAVGASLAIDRLDLDPYLAPAAKGAGKPTREPAAPADAGATATKPKAADSVNPLAPLAALADIEADLKLKAGVLIYQGTPLEGVVLDALLHGGTLTLRDARVGNVSGASAKVEGVIKGLGGVPSAEKLHVTANAQDLARVARLTGADAAGLPKGVSPVGLSATLNGSLLKPAMDLTLTAANGGQVTIKGDTTWLPKPGFAGSLNVTHPDLAGMLRRIEVGYTPTGPVGRLALASAFEANASGITLSGLTVKAGELSLSGRVAVALDRPIPVIQADLQGGPLVLDPFLPVTRTAAADAVTRFASRLAPARPRQAGEGLIVRVTSGAVSNRWSREPLDLSGLKAFEAVVGLKADAISALGYRLENADLASTVKSGVLDVKHLTGILFGGRVDAAATVDGSGSPRLDTRMRVDGMDLGRAMVAVSGKEQASGRMSLDTSLSSAGGSTADLVSSLNGRGSLVLDQLDVKSGARPNIPVLGPLLAPVFGLVGLLDNSVGDLLGALALRQGKGLADLKGTFAIANGVARSDDIRLTSAAYTADAKGTVDLPGYTVDARMEARLAENLVGALLSKVREIPKVIPVSVNGSLDNPRYRLETSQMPGGGLAIPGLDKLRKKKGVGQVLDILGGALGQQGQQGEEAPPPAAVPVPPV